MQTQLAPAARYGHASVATAAGDIYVFGGMLLGRENVSAVTGELSHYCGAWSSVPYHGGVAPRYGHSMILRRGDVGVVFGGRGSSSIYQDVWTVGFCNDPVQFVPVKTQGVQPARRWGHSCCYVAAMDTMLVVGGEGLRGEWDDCFALELNTMTWRCITSLHLPRPSTFALLLQTSRLLVLHGGRNSLGVSSAIYVAPLEAVSKDAGKVGLAWTELLPYNPSVVPSPRSMHMGFTVDADRIAIVGGRKSVGPHQRPLLSHVLDDAFVFEISSRSWKRMAVEEREFGAVESGLAPLMGRCGATVHLLSSAPNRQEVVICGGCDSATPAAAHVIPFLSVLLLPEGVRAGMSSSKTREEPSRNGALQLSVERCPLFGSVDCNNVFAIQHITSRCAARELFLCEKYLVPWLRKARRVVQETHLALRASALDPSNETQAATTTREQLLEPERCLSCDQQCVSHRLEPCGHLCVCDVCASGILQCPVCRSTVEGSHRMTNPQYAYIQGLLMHSDLVSRIGDAASTTAVESNATDVEAPQPTFSQQPSPSTCPSSREVVAPPVVVSGVRRSLAVRRPFIM